MPAVKRKIGKKRLLKIRADECLDWRSFPLFDKIANNCSHQPVSKMEIDLCKTRAIKRSGLTVLLMMIKESGLSRDEIALVNCRPEIRSQLSSCNFSSRFHLQ